MVPLAKTPHNPNNPSPGSNRWSNNDGAWQSAWERFTSGAVDWLPRGRSITIRGPSAVGTHRADGSNSVTASSGNQFKESLAIAEAEHDDSALTEGITDAPWAYGMSIGWDGVTVRVPGEVEHNLRVLGRSGWRTIGTVIVVEGAIIVASSYCGPGIHVCAMNLNSYALTVGVGGGAYWAATGGASSVVKTGGKLVDGVRISQGEADEFFVAGLVTGVAAVKTYRLAIAARDLAKVGAAAIRTPGAAATASGARTAAEAGISPRNARRIQNAANRTRQVITVVGSRANGTSSLTSDWDYIMSGPSRARHSARSSVPRGTQGGEINAAGRKTGIDLWQSYNPNAPGFNPVRPGLPHVTFTPE